MTTWRPRNEVKSGNQTCSNRQIRTTDGLSQFGLIDGVPGQLRKSTERIFGFIKSGLNPSNMERSVSLIKHPNGLIPCQIGCFPVHEVRLSHVWMLQTQCLLSNGVCLLSELPVSSLCVTTSAPANGSNNPKTAANRHISTASRLPKHYNHVMKSPYCRLCDILSLERSPPSRVLLFPGRSLRAPYFVPRTSLTKTNREKSCVSSPQG